MPPREPESEGTSLELTFPPDVGEPTAATSGTSLELPPSDSPSDPPDPPPADGTSAAPGPLGTLVAAHLQRIEISMLARVLISTLSGALPASMIRVERRRTVRPLRRHTAEPIGITITAGDRTMSFRTPRIGVCEASSGHSVRGVVLSSTPMPVAAWLDQLGELLDQVAREDEATRAALERTLLS